MASQESKSEQSRPGRAVAEWRPVPGYESRYQVSSAGEFRRLIDGAWRHMSTRSLNVNGYVLVKLSLNGEGKRMLAHRLVARAFLGEPPTPKHNVHHKDAVRTNNAVENLEWATQAENLAHCRRMGRMVFVTGEAHGSAKLTAAQAAEIRASRDGKLKLAARYGVSQSLILQIKHGLIWRRKQGEPRRPALTIKKLVDRNVSRCARWHGIDDWTPLEWAGAMAGEAGEACNAAKKLKRIDSRIANINTEEGRSLTDRETACKKIGLEIADTFIYGALLAARVGVDLEACIREAFNKKSEEYGFPERL